jgi:hypothetical protein
MDFFIDLDIIVYQFLGVIMGFLFLLSSFLIGLSFVFVQNYKIKIFFIVFLISFIILYYAVFSYELQVLLDNKFSSIFYMRGV